MASNLQRTLACALLAVGCGSSPSRNDRDAAAGDAAANEGAVADRVAADAPTDGHASGDGGTGADAPATDSAPKDGGPPTTLKPGQSTISLTVAALIAASTRVAAPSLIRALSM